MKFSTAWASIAAQNVTLKVGVAALGVSTVVLALTSVKLALKAPLVIERECRAVTAKLVPPTEHPTGEIDAFVRDALATRFNSDATPMPGYLSTAEESARAGEQKELSSRGMTQKVIPNSVKINGDSVAIDADRLISVGTIRSAFPFQLTATLTSTARTDANPSGLVLSKVVVKKAEESK